jgi:hypothetical protein
MAPIDFSDPKTYVVMAAMAIPEQLVMYWQAPSMPLTLRLSVSVVMYAATFAWNGFDSQPQTWLDEMAWIIPTALYGAWLTGDQKTGALLFVFDTIMTAVVRANM